MPALPLMPLVLLVLRNLVVASEGAFEGAGRC